MIRYITGLVVFTSLLSLGSVANAAIFITAGNTHPAYAGSPALNSVVNYAVMKNDGNGWGPFDVNWNGNPDLNSGVLDGSATYLYLYQIVNLPNGANIDFANFSIPVGVGSITSVGYFSETGFEFLDAPITSSNPSIGTIAVGGIDPEATSILTPLTVSNLANLKVIVGQSSLQIPDQDEGVYFANNYVVSADFKYPKFNAPPGDPAFSAGETSVLIGFTSNLAPVWSSVGVKDGVLANGGVPVPGDVNNPLPAAFPVVPEPASVTLWTLGLVMCGGIGYWRKRMKAVA